MLEDVGPFVYAAVGLQIAALGVWISFGPALGKACGVIAGLLGIGLLGTTPIFTACAYYRQHRLALEAAQTSLSPGSLAAAILGGGLLALAVPVAAALTAWAW